MTDVKIERKVVTFPEAVYIKNPDDPYFENPYHSIHLKVFYPARVSGIDGSELIPDTRFAPFPVVIFLPQVESNWAEYEWMAYRIAIYGYVIVIPDWFIEAEANNTSSVNIETMAPDPARHLYSSAAVILPIIEGIKSIQRRSPIAGLVDLKTVVLGGHSVGGALALINANPSMFKMVKAAFAWSPMTALIGIFDRHTGQLHNQLSPDVPMLLLGGSEDQLDISLDTFDFYTHESPEYLMQQLIKTFNEGIRRNRNDKYLAILDGGKHYTICSTENTITEGYAFIDSPDARQNYLRDLIVHIIILYLNAYILKDTDQLEQLNHVLSTEEAVVYYERK